MIEDEQLNLPEFWKQPEKVWRNITKYDLRYYYQSECSCTKNEAHQSYSQDIQYLLTKVKTNSNSYKVLKSCENILKNAHKNHVNKHFWDHEIQRFSQINLDELLAEKELEVLEKVTAVTALRSYNKKSNPASSSTIQPEEEGSDSTVYLNDNGSTYATPKRKQYDDEENTTTASKRPNQQQTLSDKFRVYKQKVMQDVARGINFSVETNVSELIALADIMLLTPSQYSRYTRDHFGDEVLNEWYSNILSNLIVDDVEKEARDISRSLDDTIYSLQRKRIKTRDAIQKLVAMSVGKEDHEAQILIGLANLVQKLPSQNLLPDATIRETELWSSVFDPILTAMFSDPDRDILLRWTNVVPEEDCISEVIRVQPDAMICEIDQLSWGCTIGYGEAKIAEPNPNTAGLANDLLRLACVTAKTVGEFKTRSVLAFQIHGYNLKVYITQKMPDSAFYTMVELFEITFPRSIQEVDLLTSRKTIESLISLYKVFWKICCVKKQDKDEAKEHASSGFDISTIQIIKD